MEIQNSTAFKALAVTPNDSTDLTVGCRSLYVGVAGNIAAQVAGGATVTFVGVPSGSILPIQASRVLATGTTATSIVALY